MPAKRKTLPQIGAPLPVEICILAGGLSSRMGRDKSRIRFGGKTLLARVRAVAAETPWPARVIRRDLVRRCGPLGGVYTALRTTTAESVLFLACDMPFITSELLRLVAKTHETRGRAVFTRSEGAAGFPFILSRSELPLVEKLMAAKRFSLQSLAARCHASVLRPPGGRTTVCNLNNPKDLRLIVTKLRLNSAHAQD